MHHRESNRNYIHVGVDSADPFVGYHDQPEIPEGKQGIGLPKFRPSRWRQNHTLVLTVLIGWGTMSTRVTVMIVGISKGED